LEENGGRFGGYFTALNRNQEFNDNLQNCLQLCTVCLLHAKVMTEKGRGGDEHLLILWKCVVPFFKIQVFIIQVSERRRTAHRASFIFCKSRPSVWNTQKWAQRAWKKATMY